jgi:hypothetical protein
MASYVPVIGHSHGYVDVGLCVLFTATKCKIAVDEFLLMPMLVTRAMWPLLSVTFLALHALSCCLVHIGPMLF